MAYKVIDVSTHNTVTDWAAVKASGVWGVMIRAGYGREVSQKDKKFEQHYAGAKAAGLHVGAYWYSYANSVADAKKEASACLEVIKGKRFDLPVAFDVEDPSLPRDKAVLSDMVVAFGDTLEKAGYFVSLYASLSWLNSRLDYAKIKRFSIWLAQWASKPTYANKFDMWQYTSSGAVKGINGRVDMNECTRNFPVEIKKIGLNGYNKLGDLNGDGKVDTGDAILALQKAAAMNVSIDMDAADVNGDGKVDSGDAVLLLQKSAELIDNFPIK